MKVFFLIITIIAGIALIVIGQTTGYAVVEACPQPSWVYLNKPALSEVNNSIAQRVEDYFNSTASGIRSFFKGKEYYLVEFIYGNSIRECVTDLSITCGCQENRFSAFS